MTAISTSDATFQEDVLAAKKPVLVDFWAEWCGPCKMVAPVLDEIARDHGDALTVAKLNVDDNPATAAAYRITSIPTMLVVVNGEVVHEIVGAKPKQALLTELDAFF
jgi:thioredoxin 1